MGNPAATLKAHPVILGSAAVIGGYLLFATEFIVYGDIKPTDETGEDLGFGITRQPDGAIKYRFNARLFNCKVPDPTTPEGEAALKFVQGLIEEAGNSGVFTVYGYNQTTTYVDGMLTLSGKDINLTNAIVAAGHGEAA